jgi:hypothetical protein
MWGIADATTGATVAHLAATCGTLPERFDQWSLSTPDGETVAHRAARHGNLPAYVPDGVLALRDGKGKSVAELVWETACRSAGRRKTDVSPDGLLQRAKSVMETAGLAGDTTVISLDG